MELGGTSEISDVRPSLSEQIERTLAEYADTTLSFDEVLLLVGEVNKHVLMATLNSLHEEQRIRKISVPENSGGTIPYYGYPRAEGAQ